MKILFVELFAILTGAFTLGAVLACFVKRSICGPGPSYVEDQRVSTRRS